ncbi:MAG TPA: hypothetical protein VKR31_10335 [Rhizomicrobium sp.]|nr:hypothetical protein [Rhizomicrobium sp.]
MAHLAALNGREFDHRAYCREQGIQDVTATLTRLIYEDKIRRDGRSYAVLAPKEGAKPAEVQGAVRESGIASPTKFQLMTGFTRKRRRLYEDVRP